MAPVGARARRRRWPLVLVAMLGVAWAMPAVAQDRAREAEIKATYLLNFGRFVRWPAASDQAGAPFVVCVLGRDEFGRVLDDVFAGESVNGRATAVRRLTTLDAVGGCHILYLASDVSRQVPAMLQATAASPVLTVSELPDFIERGGMIQFVQRAGRIRFQLNVTAAQGVGLEPSADLSRVAEIVRRPGGGN